MSGSPQESGESSIRGERGGGNATSLSAGTGEESRQTGLWRRWAIDYGRCCSVSPMRAKFRNRGFPSAIPGRPTALHSAAECCADAQWINATWMCCITAQMKGAHHKWCFFKELNIELKAVLIFKCNVNRKLFHKCVPSILYTYWLFKKTPAFVKFWHLGVFLNLPTQLCQIFTSTQAHVI